MGITRQTEFALTLDVLRDLMTPNRGAVISHQVGKALLHNTPLFDRMNREEMWNMLTDLMDELRQRLAAEDLSPDVPSTGTLPKRLRDEAAYLAALCTYAANVTDDDEERTQVTEEGISWAQIAEDRLQEALLYQIRAWRSIDLEAFDQVAIDYRSAIRLAAEGGHLATELQLRYMLISALLYSNSLSEAEKEGNAFFDVIRKELEGEDRDFHLARALRVLGTIALKQKNAPDAVRYLEEGLDCSDESIDPVNRASTLFALADAYHSIGASAKAIELLIEGAGIGERTGRVVISSKAFARIGDIHLELNDYVRAREAFELAERFVADISLALMQWQLRFQKLQLYLQIDQQTDRTDEGIELCHQLLDHYDSAQHRITILEVLGLLFEKKGAMEQAHSSLQSAWDASGKPLLKLGIPLARILIAQGSDDKADQLLNLLCSKEPEQTTELNHYAEGLHLLSGIARRNEDYVKAIELLEKGSDVRIRIERSRNEESIQKARILAEINVQREKKRIVESRRELAEQRMAQLLTGLQQTHGTLKRIQGRLREGLAWLEPEQLEQVVTVMKNAINDRVTEEVVEKVVSEADALLALRGVGDQFFDQLSERWPHLTKKQRQLCGMIRADLKTSQIAHLLGITNSSVWTQRKRLRQRMELKPGENLKEIVMAIDG